MDQNRRRRHAHLLKILHGLRFIVFYRRSSTDGDPRAGQPSSFPENAAAAALVSCCESPVLVVYMYKCTTLADECAKGACGAEKSRGKASNACNRTKPEAKASTERRTSVEGLTLSALHCFFYRRSSTDNDHRADHSSSSPENGSSSCESPVFAASFFATAF